MESLTFNGRALSDFGCFFDGSKAFGKPEKDVDFVSVPGRSGDLSFSNNRYMNISVVFPCFIRENFKANYSALINYLSSQSGYLRLEYSTEPDIYREGAFVGSVEPETGSFNTSGRFNLSFNCKPQKWLRTGETWQTITSGATVTNPTLMLAKPQFVVFGTGSLTIGDNSVELTRNTSSARIDSDLQDAYQGTINRNPYLNVTNGFPVLEPGDNTVTFTGFSEVRIQPRWWRL